MSTSASASDLAALVQVPLDTSIYTGLEVSVERVPFNQDAYDAALLKLRDQHADLVEVPAPRCFPEQLSTQTCRLEHRLL